MGKVEFIEELKSLVSDVQDHGDDKVSFKYVPDAGRCAGQEFRVGFAIPGDFGVTPPSGPHIKPRIFPNQSGGPHPTGGIHDSPFGADWHYWSRPISGWPETKRSVRDILLHLERLFITL